MYGQFSKSNLTTFRIHNHSQDRGESRAPENLGFLTYGNHLIMSSEKSSGKSISDRGQVVGPQRGSRRTVPGCNFYSVLLVSLKKSIDLHNSGRYAHPQIPPGSMDFGRPKTTRKKIPHTISSEVLATGPAQIGSGASAARGA